MGLNIAYLKTPSGILKIFEIALVVSSFAVMRDYQTIGFNIDAMYFGIGILVSCMIITPLLLVCYLMGKMEIQQTIMEVSVNFVFAIFLLTFGAMGIDFYKTAYFQKDEGLAMASLALIASFAYFADTVFAVLNYRK